MQATLLEKRLWHRCFPVNFAKFLGTPFLQNTSWQMLLEIKFTSNKQYLFGRLFSRNAKKTNADQSTSQAFVLCLKRNDSQTFKSSSCEKLFLQCVCYKYIKYNVLRWMFFIPYDNWKTLFFVKVCRYFKIFSIGILVLSLKQVFWRSPYFTLFPQ